MKNNIILLTTLFLLSLSSCQKSGSIDEESLNLDPDAIKFMATMTSRATDTAFESGDQISVTAYSSTGAIYADNVRYTFSDNLFTSDASIKFAGDNQALSFRALYPYVEMPESKVVEFSVKSDQSSGSNYTLSDLMSSYVNPTTSMTPTLSFDHLMTKFIINVTSADVEMVNVISTINAVSSVEYNLTTLSSTPIGTAQAITMANDGINSYKAIIAPQEIEANTTFVTITVADVPYEISFSQSVSLLGGKQYTIDITIIDGKIVFDSPLINDWEEGEFPEVEEFDDRSALVALYNATGGDDWYCNTNWCSDAPISEWYGVTVNDEGRVTELFLKYNGLSGEIGDVLQPLTALESIEFSATNYFRLIDGSALTTDALTSGKENYLTGDIDLSKCVNLTSVILDGEGYSLLDSILGAENLSKLETLSMHMTYVKSIDISKCYNLAFLNLRMTSITSGVDISLLNNLEYFNFSVSRADSETELIFGDNNKLIYLEIECVDNIKNLDTSGFTELTDISIQGIDNTDLYIDISDCTKLVNVSIYNNDATITLNTDLSQCPDLVKFYIMDCNLLSSNLEFTSTTTQRVIVDNCGLESIDVTKLINLTDITVSDNKLKSLVLPSSNSLYNVYCENNEIEGEFSDVFAQMLRSNYSSSLFILNCSNNNITGNLPEVLAERSNLSYFVCCHNKMSGTIPEAIVKNSYFAETNDYAHTYCDPDNNDYHSHYYSGCCINPQKDGYGLIVPTLDYYNSEDYSQDGVVLTLQTASEGTGIDLVFVGDGFVDTQMGTGGEYETRMKQAMEAFFDEEPLKTFRDRYNVYAVKAVSQNEGIGDGRKTVFNSVISDGSTLISGDDTSVFEYALKVPTIMNTNNLTTICILNSYTYAGTCYMYYSNNASVAYCPIVYNSDTDFKNIILHEGAGHGFGKLADEYYYSGTITTSAISTYNYQKGLGWMSNVDVTNDPTTIRWSHMISDPVYTNYVDIIQGALSYQYGAYRPTSYSIMYHNTGGFNAPSREAIYKWIMEFSGDTYSFEKFKEYDQINLTQTAAASRAAQANSVDISTFKPTAPPVMIEGRPKAQKQ